MGSRPVRMANSDIRVCLQKSGNDQPVDPIFGSKIKSLSDQFEVPIIIRGQPRFARNKYEIAKMSGDGEETLGYIVIAYDELEAKHVTEEELKNAKITGFKRRGNWVTEAFIINRVDPRGHLSEGPLIVKAYFTKHKDAIGSK